MQLTLEQSAVRGPKADQRDEATCGGFMLSRRKLVSPKQGRKVRMTHPVCDPDSDHMCKSAAKNIAGMGMIG
jgi:hypothetical protein